MKTTFRTRSITILSLGFLIFLAACSKDEPTPEIPQEEIKSATLTFTEVEWLDDQPHDLEDPAVITIKFEDGLPAEGSNSHIHLDAGATYQLTLSTTDFAGREGAEQEFLDDADIHQVFILGAPEGVLDYDYGDAEGARVGVTGYLHVLKPSEGFVFNFILRHLNEGVKSSITADDWNNPQYTKFSGENDLDLNVELHPVENGDDGH